MSLTHPQTRAEEAVKVVWDRFYRTSGPEIQDALLHLANVVDVDDAVHIAAPWEPRSTLCGNWHRIRIAYVAPGQETPAGLTESTFWQGIPVRERPNGWEGCWTCLMAAEKLDAMLAAAYADGAQWL